MKKINFLFFKIYLVMMLFISTQYCFSKNDTPIVIIRKDDTSEPIPTQTNGIVSVLTISATINDTELTVFFESTVGDALITITSDSIGMTYQGVVDTCIDTETFIPVNEWCHGNYTLTISYGKTTLKGEFLIE